MFHLLCCWKKYRFIHYFSCFPLLTSAWWAVFLAINHRFGHDDFTLLRDASQQLNFKSTSLTLCSSIAFCALFFLFLKRISTFFRANKYSQVHRKPQSYLVTNQEWEHKFSLPTWSSLLLWCFTKGRGIFMQVKCYKMKKMLRSESSKKIPHCTKKFYKKKIKKLIIIKDPL